ncbi:venom allergen 5 isoform X2 [Agrilus planipennis]|uniref:Venom allergen 5 isoform X1 n=1 Tax=Agrilus planipennis TaxID=224129 RepID=A0A7F5RMD2_AGRPL|nr:venom allergen 5 isoform X1 [Agrilus planipennis]XP_025837101.1 venom allergen 5 isoform X2 [Agrilus planipennis]
MNFDQAIVVILGILTLIARFGNACRGRIIYRANGVTEREKQIILNTHNGMRQSVALGQIRGQPQAANLLEMKWDDELAYKAQQWATTCKTYHHDHHRHVARFPVGQNVARTWTTKPPESAYETEPDFEDIIKNKWFGEFKNFRYGPLNFVNDLIGHYTQMIWAETYLVGCGYAFYFEPGKGFVKSYVCNYGPSGNVLRQQPYKTGQPSCYSFGMSNSHKYYGLCETQTTFITTVADNYLHYY